jgi:hypothetical protein
MFSVTMVLLSVPPSMQGERRTKRRRRAVASAVNGEIDLIGVGEDDRLVVAFHILTKCRTL